MLHTLSVAAELMRGKALGSAQSKPESFIEITLHGVTGNRENWGLSHLCYVTICSHIGNKKQLIQYSTLNYYHIILKT